MHEKAMVFPASLASFNLMQKWLNLILSMEKRDQKYQIVGKFYLVIHSNKNYNAPILTNDYTVYGICFVNISTFPYLLFYFSMRYQSEEKTKSSKSYFSISSNILTLYVFNSLKKELKMITYIHISIKCCFMIKILIKSNKRRKTI